MKESKTRQATVEFASQLLKEFKEQRRFYETANSRERFTQRTPNGASLILGEPRTQAEAAAILKEQFKKACNYLCELEDKLESGQLVDTTPYILEIKNEIPFKYKVIKPTVHMRNVEMCDSRESAERCIVKLTEATK